MPPKTEGERRRGGQASLPILSFLQTLTPSEGFSLLSSCRFASHRPPSPSPAPTWPSFPAYLIGFAAALVCLACNDGGDDHQMKCAGESVSHRPTE